MDIQLKLVDQDSEIHQIKELQEANLKQNISIEEAELEGFVTAVYTIDFLKRMHSFHPSVIAKHQDKVVGYALVTTKDIREEHELLSDLFLSIDRLTHNNELLSTKNYVIVGQLCVAKGYRGLGIVQSMYQYFRQMLSPRYDCAVTDVADNNQRSLKAHFKSGFIPISKCECEGKPFTIVILDWSI